MKRTLVHTIGKGAALAVLAGSFVHSSYAAYMTFDPSSYSAKVGDTITVPVVIDGESDTMRGADMYISYDATKLKPTSIVPNRNFFPQIVNQMVSGKIYIGAEQNDPTLNVTGKDTVASINFEVLAAGTSQLTYDCDEQAAKTSLIVRATANSYAIVSCDKNGTATITGGSGSTTTTTTTTTTTPRVVTPTPKPQVVVKETLPKSGAAETSLLVGGMGALLTLGGAVLRGMLLRN